jgi:hypothetical protein
MALVFVGGSALLLDHCVSSAKPVVPPLRTELETRISFTTRTVNGHAANEFSVTLPRCTPAQLRVSGVEANGAAVTGGWIVRFRNASAHECSLSGYASVRGINQWNGAVLTAAHTLNSYIGGSPSNKGIPTIDLKAGGGVASILIDFVSGNNIRACPYVTSLRVSVPHSTTVFTLKVRLQVCKHFQVHPFVFGLTGGNL